MPDRYPRGSLQRRTSGAVEERRPGALERNTVAVYDRTTDGMVGYEFMRTRRWGVYVIGAIVFAIVCGFLSHWQYDLAVQGTRYNAQVQKNYNGAPVPLAQALPTLGGYRGVDVVKRVTLTGTYLTQDQLVVRTRPCGDNTGFEILTPVRLADGTTFVVDRGCLDASSKNADVPVAIPKAPSGAVTVTARLEATEKPRGSTPAIKNQIESIDLAQVKQRIGGRVYTGAYGVLESQTPTSKKLGTVLTSAPSANTAMYWSYMIQWALFGIGGFVALIYAMQTEFRRLNADDPEERARARARREKAARRKFTDAEAEDEILDGYVPLSRWGVDGPVAIAAPGAGPKFALDEATTSAPRPTPSAGAPKRAPHDVIVIQPSEPDAAAASSDRESSDRD